MVKNQKKKKKIVFFNSLLSNAPVNDFAELYFFGAFLKIKIRLTCTFTNVVYHFWLRIA